MFLRHIEIELYAPQKNDGIAILTEKQEMIGNR
jgi:hypothetical protein